MAFTHGRKARLKIGSDDLSAFLDNSGLDSSRDTAETSVYTVDSKTYVSGLKDGKFSLSGPYDTDIEASDLLVFYESGEATTFEYGPQGTSAPNAKFTGACLVTSFKVETPLGGAAKFSAEVQISGDVTRTAYA